MDYAQYPNNQQARPMYSNMSYTSDGRPVPTQTYAPESPVRPNSVLGAANFSGLIGNQVTVPAVPAPPEPAKKRKKKTPNEKGEIAVDVINPENDTLVPANSKEIVESTIYADTYAPTNMITAGIIKQADELLNGCKEELDFIRAQRNMKRKYLYMNNTITSMSSLLNTKLAAVREINSNIKNANDAEYRRFKDMRAMDSTDDTKAIMDAYSAFISAPVGAPVYKQPGTMNLTAGLDGIVRADYPAEVQKTMDAGLANYLGNMSPEEYIMLNGDNNLEEVIVYDEATGVKQFQWLDKKTGKEVNLPPSSTLTIEDYTIDPRTKTARNVNVNDVKRVIVKNEGEFNKY